MQLVTIVTLAASRQEAQRQMYRLMEMEITRTAELRSLTSERQVTRRMRTTSRMRNVIQTAIRLRTVEDLWMTSRRKLRTLCRTVGVPRGIQHVCDGCLPRKHEERYHRIHARLCATGFWGMTSKLTERGRL